MLSELAALLEARQREREARYQEVAPADEVGEQDIELYEPRFEPAEHGVEPAWNDVDRHEPHLEADEEDPEDLGERFGWSERDAGDEVRQYLDGHEEEGRRRFAAPLLRVGGLVAVSAAAALLAVSLLGSSDPAIEDEAPALETAVATPDEAPAEFEAPLAAVPAREDADRLVPSAAVPAAELAQPMNQPRPTFARSDVRTILPAPAMSSSTGLRTTQAGPAETDGAAAEAEGQQTAEAEAPGNWMAPGPALRQQAEPQVSEAAAPAEDVPETGMAVPALAPGETEPARATTSVNMRAEPENGATVLAVIPENAAVDLIGCDVWCEVVYENQQGWVYRDFIAAAAE